MRLKKLFSMLFLFSAFAIPSFTNAKNLEHYVSSDAYGTVIVNTFDGCIYNSITVQTYESTIKGATTVPYAFVSVYSSSSCTGEFVYWEGASDNITFSHTPANHNQ